MTRQVGVGDLVLVSHLRRDEPEREGTHIDIRDRLFDLRHMAGHAFPDGAVGLMMRVSFDGRGMRTVRGRRTMATQTELVHGLDQVSVVAGPMNVMTIEMEYALDITPVEERLKHTEILIDSCFAHLFHPAHLEFLNCCPS
jgi:hypothetical protein